MRLYDGHMEKFIIMAYPYRVGVADSRPDAVRKLESIRRNVTFSDDTKSRIRMFLEGGPVGAGGQVFYGSDGRYVGEIRIITD